MCIFSLRYIVSSSDPLSVLVNRSSCCYLFSYCSARALITQDPLIASKDKSTLELIGGSGGAPRKVRPQVAFIWLFRTQYGYLTGTNDVYMGINSHICIQIVPPKLVGGFRGAKPPESTFAPPYKFKRSSGRQLRKEDY